MQALKADPALSRIPVVAISANPEQLPKGVAAAFAKPFEPTVLMDEIRRLCPPAGPTT